MIKLLDLPELGKRIASVDKHLLEVVLQRMRLSLQVGEYKQVRDEPIYRNQAEESRLQSMREMATSLGINPNFASALLYLIIGESCKQQMIQLQAHPELKGLENMQDEAWHENLKRNLLALTQLVASTYDQKYDQSYFATNAYLKFEDRELADILEGLDSRELVIDLGCATGVRTFKLAPYFVQARGFDLSPAMIGQAIAKLGDNHIKNTDFEVADLEEGITLEDGSVSLAVLNFGTASEIHGIDKMIDELTRVLQPGGFAFLSFYNSDALRYRWGFVPWPTGLAAEINMPKHCLDVHLEGLTYEIYAKAYNRLEVEALLAGKLEIVRVSSFPTISSILPREVFQEDLIAQAIVDLDMSMVESNLGAYLTAVVRKV